MNSTTKRLVLKGMVFCGEAYPKCDEGNLIGGIYKLVDGTFVVIKREEYSGRLLSVEATDPKAWRKFRTLQLSANTRVQMYCVRETVTA